MREILFRGKMVDGLGWIEGSLIKWKHFNGKNYEDTYSIKDLYCNEFLVHPESVGQFTGLHDKNGKRIFEGDVLKLTYDGYSFNCEVKFNDGGFLVYHDNGFNGGDADMTMIGWLKHDDYQFEIIGNIHDSADNLPTH